MTVVSPLVRDDLTKQAIGNIIVRRKAKAKGMLAPAAKWHDDPVGFARECFHWRDGEGLAPYQEEILQAVVDHHYVSFRGPRGMGKTMLQAIIDLWFAITREAAEEDWKLPNTAGGWGQLKDYLWPEIRKWARRLNWEKVGRKPFVERIELLDLGLKLQHGAAFGLSPKNPELIEGAHADQLLVGYDESKAIPQSAFDAMHGAFSQSERGSGRDGYAIMASTPGTPSGPFYDVHRRALGTEQWWVRHVTIEECLAAGRVTQEWVDLSRAKWGEESPLYQQQVLGQFATNDEECVIPLSWVQAAQQRWQDWKDSDGWLPPLTTAGVDVGRSGDKTVIAPKHKHIVGELKRYPIGDTMMTTGRVIQVVSETRATAIVDVIGIGAGVFDRLKERKAKTGAEWDVRAFVASGKSPRLDRSGSMGFVNQRADAWWNLREKLDPTYDDAPLLLPPDDELTRDLTTPKYSMQSNGRYQIEAKDEIVKRLGRSPDAGDAVVMACYEDKAPQARQEAESVQVTDSYGVRGFARRDRLFR